MHGWLFGATCGCTPKHRWDTQASDAYMRTGDLVAGVGACTLSMQDDSTARPDVLYGEQGLRHVHVRYRTLAVVCFPVHVHCEVLQPCCLGYFPKARGGRACPSAITRV